MRFRLRRSRWERLGLVKKGDPPEPLLLETSAGLFRLGYGISVGVSAPAPHPIFLYVSIYDLDGDMPDEVRWADDVASVRDLAELLFQTGMPDDEAGAVARRRFGEAVRYVREGWPGVDLQVDPDELSST